jgi:predicted lipoprotein with Yx(FWY)xxD motif
MPGAWRAKIPRPLNGRSSAGVVPCYTPPGRRHERTARQSTTTLGGDGIRIRRYGAATNNTNWRILMSKFSARVLAARLATVVIVATTLTACREGNRAAARASDGDVAASVPGAIKTSSLDGVGAYLTDVNGRSLYMFDQDTTNVSTCSGLCAVAWQPFAGGESVDPDVLPAMLGMIDRNDGRRQATYNGMPVYYYDDDKAPGDIEGQGKEEFGGLWYLVSPNGRAIRAARTERR